MKRILIAGLVLAASAGLPALSQTSPAAGAAGTSGTTGATSSGQQSGASQAGQSAQSRVVSQSQVRDVLTKAGFKEVQILDAAYLVQARTPANETVVLMVDPSGMMKSASGTGGTAGAAAGGTASGAQSSAGSPGAAPTPPPRRRSHNW